MIVSYSLNIHILDYCVRLFEILYSIFARLNFRNRIMEEKTIRRNLYRVLRKTGVKKESILPNASFNNDLHFDKIDWTIFTFFLEGIFNISVKDEELNSFGYVNDTLHYLEDELVYLKN